MKYIKPAIEINEVTAATQMLAESLPINDTPIDGDEALSKGDASWNLWSDED